MTITLIDLIRALDKEPAAAIVTPVPHCELRRGDTVFYAGRWRTVKFVSAYHMKDSNRVWLSAWTFDGEEYSKCFTIPRNERLLRRIT